MSEERRPVDDLDETEEIELEDEEAEVGDEPLPDEGEEEGVEGDDGDGGGEEEQRQDVRRPARPSPRQRQAAQLRREREERAAEKAAYEDRLAALERQQTPPRHDPQAQARAEQAELERIRQLPYEEQLVALNDRTERRVAAALGNTRAEIQDASDRAEFRDLQRDEPAARRMAAEVERQMTDGRARGIQGLTRVAVYNYLVGQETREKMRKAGDRQRRTGRANIRRETTRPGASGRSAQATAGGRRQADNSPEAVRARLRGVRLTREDF